MRKVRITELRRRLALLAAITVALDASTAAAPGATFADLSIEELLNESVTSVSRKETTLGRSPAAIAVITQEDIQRTGHTSLPELLRLVPGLQVARIHGNEWAVSSRGFNGQYANKLLVLIDGRSIYSPMFAGVYWNAQDVVLEDVDRIEVIRGPGATLWGANAVNGVINVTTKPAQQTQGGFISTTFGTEERPSATVRQGGQLAPNLYYRVSASGFERHGFAEKNNGVNPDDWSMLRFGGRVDWEPTEADLLTLQGDYYHGSVGEHFAGVSLTPPFSTDLNLSHHNFGGNVLGRWTHHFSASSELRAQVYYDRFHQGDGDSAETRDTFDFELSHRFSPGGRHDVIWGGGYRLTTDRLTPTFYLSFTPEREKAQLFSFFLQDEITFVPDRLALTVGSKLEHHEHVGFEVQPGVRLLWTPSRRQTLWSSISRAVRTPSRYDRGSRINAAAFQPPSSPTMLLALLGSRDAVSETLTAYEAGYRAELGKRVSLDLAGFFNVYDDLLSFVSEDVRFEGEPAPAHLLMPLRLENMNSGRTYGTEISMQWRASDRWSFVASHTWLHLDLRADEAPEQESPQHQFQLRSYFDVTPALQLNVAGYYVDAIESPQDNARARIGSHTRVDVGLNWRVHESLDLGIWGQNLLEGSHAEFGSFKTPHLAEIPRSFSLRARWRY